MRAEQIYRHILEGIIVPLVGNKTTYQDALMKTGKHMLGNNFRGVFPSDKIPSLPENGCAIVNLDSSGKPGSHWVGIARRGGTTYHYDSFGRSYRDILSRLKGRVLDTEQDAEQNVFEENCGARSLAWLVLFKFWGPEMAQKI